MSSGVNRARSGELRPTSRKTAATTGRRSVRHCSSSSLRRRTRESGHRRPRRSRPHEAAPVELVRRRRADELEEHVLEGRPGLLERGEDDARRDDDREDLAGGRGRVRDGHPDRARGDVRAGRPRRRPQARRRGPSTASPWPGAGTSSKIGRAWASSRSASGPSVTSRPRSRIATRSQIRSTSARTWVETITVAWFRGGPRSARAGPAGPRGRASSPARRGSAAPARGSRPGRCRAAAASRRCTRRSAARRRRRGRSARSVSATRDRSSGPSSPARRPTSSSSSRPFIQP